MPLHVCVVDPHQANTKQLIPGQWSCSSVCVCVCVVQVLVRYKPQALGKHPSEIRIRVYPEKSDVLVQELALQVR